MKILVLCAFPAPYRIAIFNGLADYYGNLTVLFHNNKDQSRSADYYDKNFKFKSYFACDKQSYFEFNKNACDLKEYDLILAYDYYLSSGIKVLFKAVLLGVPYIVNSDGGFVKKKSWKDWVKRFFLKRATCFFSSGKGADNYLLEYGANKENIYHHNFTSLYQSDLKNMFASPKLKSELRTKYGLNNCFTYIFVGQFIDRKNVEAILNCWKEYDNYCQLLLVGGGPNKDNYLKIIKNEKLKNVFIFDFKPKSEIFELYYASDVMLLPTKEDTWGLVVNEAISCGLPVISSNMSNAALELITDGKNGFIYEANNNKQLNKYMTAIQSVDFKEVAQYDFNIIEHYTYESVIKSHVTIINKIFGYKKEINEE